jgi:hypothetical protein
LGSVSSPSAMAFLDPDYPHIIWAFHYRGWKLEIDQSALDGQVVYSVWANHETGCAIAVPCAHSRPEAIRRGKQYVDWRLSNADQNFPN